MSRITSQLPVTDTTANAIPVTSSTGFDSGELIYYKNGDYAPISNSAVTSAPFDISQTQPYRGASSFGPYYTTGDNETKNYGSKSKCVAKLSNGNLVRVYIPYQGGVYYPSFEIYNQSNVQVVGKTTVSTTYTMSSYGTIAVAAFASGGFVVAWVNDTGGTGWSINFAVYDNNGTQVLAATQSTAVTVQNTSQISVATTSDNKFYIAVHNNANNVYLTCFNQAGTSQFTAINTGISGSASWPIGLTTRSDNSAAVVSAISSGATSFGYRLYSSGGTTLDSKTFTPSGSSVSPACDIDCLVDGTTLVLGYNVYNSAYYWGYVTIPSSNVISAEYTIPSSNSLNTPYTSYGANGYNMVVKALSSGGWIMFFCDPSYAVVYAAFNSSGTCISGTNSGNNKAAPIYMPASYWPLYMSAGVVETTGQVNFYFSPTSYGNIRLPMVFAKINTSNWSLVPNNFRTQVVGTSNSAVNAYSKTNSGPSYAKFVASTNSTLSFNGTMGYSSAVLPITSSSVNALHSSTWNNGSFAVAYRSGTANYVNIYNSDAVLQTTIFVGTTSAGTPVLGPTNAIRVACLAGGGFAVAWMKSSWTTITVTTYDSGYTAVGEVSSGQCYTMDGSTPGYNFDLAALATGGSILVWTYSYPYYMTMNSSGSIVINSTIVFGNTSPNDVAVACDPWGGWACSWDNNAAGVPIISAFITYDGGLTYSNTSNYTSFSSVSSSYGSRKMTCNAVGMWFMSWYSSGGAINIYCLTRTMDTGPWSNGQTFTVGDYRGAIVGSTGNGTFVVTNTHPSATLRAWGMNQALFPSGSSGVPSSLTFQLSGISPYNSTNSQLQNMTPMAGYNTLLTFISGSLQPYMVMINAYPYTATTNVTAATSISSAVAINPGTNGTLNGYILQGVSTTSASAGGTGLVQTNGSATLNSNYSASAPASTFDFTMPNGSGISGVKGNAVGRSVTLKGTT